MQKYPVQVQITGDPGRGWTRITDRFLAPATAAVVQAYRDIMRMREIEEYNGFTIMLRVSGHDGTGCEILLGIPRTALAVRASGLDAGDFRAACGDVSDRPIMEAIALMRKQIDLALVAQLQKDTSQYEPVGYTRELPMYRGFALYLYEERVENRKRATIAIHARTAVAQLYSVKPDGESALHTSTVTSQASPLSDIESIAKQIVDMAYAKPHWSRGAMTDLSLEIPPKPDTAA